jgi:hypothetical protein
MLTPPLPRQLWVCSISRVCPVYTLAGRWRNVCGFLPSVWEPFPHVRASSCSRWWRRRQRRLQQSWRQWCPVRIGSSNPASPPSARLAFATSLPGYAVPAVHAAQHAVHRPHPSEPLLWFPFCSGDSPAQCGQQGGLSCLAIACDQLGPLAIQLIGIGTLIL